MLSSDDAKSSFGVGVVKSFDTLFVDLDLLTTRVKYVILVMEVVILKPLIVYLLVMLNLRRHPSTLVENVI